MNYYDFMDRLDKFCIEKAEEYDFRELTVICNKVAGVEVISIKDSEGDIVESIVLNCKGA